MVAQRPFWSAKYAGGVESEEGVEYGKQRLPALSP